MSVHPTMNTTPPLSWPNWEEFLSALENIVPVLVSGRGGIPSDEIFPMTLNDIDEAMQERRRRLKTISEVFPIDIGAPLVQRPDPLQDFVDQQPAPVVHTRMGRPRASDSM